MKAPTTQQMTRFLEKRFAEHADRARAGQQQAYMLSSLRFAGVPMKVVRSAAAELATTHAAVSLAQLWPSLEGLLHSDHFDLRSAALAVVEKRQRELTIDDLEPLVELARHTACWAHVDWVSSLVGLIVKRHPTELRRLRGWIKDDSFWVQRVALICQNSELRQGRGDFALLCELAVPLLTSKEFFLRKAIGWALRDASRHRQAEVTAFVAQHHQLMSGLTKREALRHLPDSALQARKR